MDHATRVQPPLAVTASPGATVWLRLSVLYLIVGVGLGIAMGATENFALRPVPVHLNQLGWAMPAVSGLIYAVYPEAGASRLAGIHFWLHNLALPAMMGSLTLLLLGHAEVLPVLVASEITAAVGVIVFACNVFRNVNAAARRRG
jgi:hypothetical protein